MEEIIEAVIFKIGDILCGLDIRHVQEICKNTDITRVYYSPAFISGVINLRGTVVTVINLRHLFKMKENHRSVTSRIIIVDSGGERIGLLVDIVHDIIEIDRSFLEPPPSNIKGVAGSLFTSIYKKPRELVSIMNLEEVLKIRTE
ncbi:MAG: chemotaxis protein CheW [Candidatus Eremiobacteraeota bacterium]|nr:chemotaxis protein CheW [Candidatus Eremiobacteraeota bacterium]